MTSTFTRDILLLLQELPEGWVVSYGQLATFAGNPRGARQVVRILHTQSEKEDLCWHRVLNRNGEISLPRGRGFEEQKALLESEGVEVSVDGKVDMERFQWSGPAAD